MKRILTVLAASSVISLFASPALAGPQDIANRIATEVMSPFCDGVTLENCPSEEAVQLRATIAHKASAGWSEVRIMSWLKTQYGIEAAAPSDTGVGLLAWLLPGLAAVAGIAILVALLRRWTSRRRPEEQRIAAISAGDRTRLDHELAEIRRRS
jgi:cytochrome c-type biogenesis protein CcmH/NrfF